MKTNRLNRLFLMRLSFMGLLAIMMAGALLYLAGWRRGAEQIAHTAGLLGALFIFLHGAAAIGWRRLAGFTLLAAMTGYWAEVFSLHCGSLFGCVYHYPADRWNDMVLGMPLSVALFWAVFIYGGYGITNAFLFFLGGSKPNRNRPRSGRLLLLLPVIDATIITAIDIYMDPLVALRGSWVWEKGGPFYGVPIGNFVGWFAISWLVTVIFRSFEYFRPGLPAKLKPLDHLTPSLAYGLLLFMFTVYSISAGRLEITLTGLFAMGPVILLSLLAFGAYRENPMTNGCGPDE